MILSCSHATVITMIRLRLEHACLFIMLAVASLQIRLPGRGRLEIQRQYQRAGSESGRFTGPLTGMTRTVVPATAGPGRTNSSSYDHTTRKTAHGRHGGLRHSTYMRVVVLSRSLSRIYSAPPVTNMAFLASKGSGARNTTFSPLQLAAARRLRHGSSRPACAGQAVPRRPQRCRPASPA